MHERLVPLILRAAREMRECADSGEHPLAALRAVIACTGEALGLGMYGRADPDWYRRLSSVRGGLERAVSAYPVDGDRAAAIVRDELRRLAPLVKLAQDVRDAERVYEAWYEESFA